MLVSLTAENWKSIERATINVDALTVLIGTNSSGKSNLLDALQFLNRISSGTMLTAALQGDAAVSPLRGAVEWAARKPGNTFALSVTFRVDEGQDLVYRIECSTENNRCELLSETLERFKFPLNKKGQRGARNTKIKLYSTDQVAQDAHSIVARLYNERGGTSRQLSRANAILFQLVGQKSREEIQAGLDVIITSLRGIFILDPIPSHMRNFAPLADQLAPDAGNIAGVLAGLPDSTRASIEETLTRYASQLPERDIARVYTEKVGKFATDAMLYCEEHFEKDQAAFVVDARGMSDGTLRFLAILTALLTRPRRSLLVVEEVDNGLHPSRSQLLLSMLQEIGTQREVDVMVTTHNPALLDAMGDELVPFITVAHRDVETGSTVLTLLEEIDQLPKLLAQGPVGRLSSRGLIEKALQDQAGGSDGATGDHQTKENV